LPARDDARVATSYAGAGFNYKKFVLESADQTEQQARGKKKQSSESLR
jgi:hypothetical protein